LLKIFEFDAVLFGSSELLRIGIEMVVIKTVADIRARAAETPMQRPTIPRAGTKQPMLASAWIPR
jgi:hypothetical protein